MSEPDTASSSRHNDQSAHSSTARAKYPRAAKSWTDTESSFAPSGEGSETSQQLHSTLKFSTGPTLTVHELEILHKTVCNTIVPSWLTRVPHKVGMPMCGTLKAAEWLSLYTVYMVLSLVAYHNDAEPHSDASKIHLGITLATQIVNICFSRSLTPDDVNTLPYLLSQYRVVGQTMIKKHTQRGFFLNFLRNIPPKYAKEIGANIILRAAATNWKPYSPSSEIAAAIKPILHEMDCDTALQFQMTSSWKFGGKCFSTYAEHHGDSYVEFIHQGTKGYGVIHYIIRSHEHAQPMFVLHVFRDLDSQDEHKNPYRLLPHLNATVKYNHNLILKAFLTKDIIGHCAALHNPAQTFCINKPTVSLVGLQSMSMADMSSSDNRRS
ncbi:uncharacterized protein MELLADRAFT_103726 [Melampsora larici-populina 98AG31]|uniref:Uncharacterized protein n=1 Tax=Melampsora larici-populina (strain 98AG31 / pathotype 3-4-7) TaxID=747676 RepID=F4RC65_MELLP|nr:uncharacterized protein MELLADRAFT_103726 [Melampsora larici-populina 98AG31]EGG09683.1 hypothetical protein MELLADRAFT_103726 [Melampsora larici-populina 98AG31]